VKTGVSHLIFILFFLWKRRREKVSINCRETFLQNFREYRMSGSCLVCGENEKKKRSLFEAESSMAQRKQEASLRHI
jgi:hypothetical protein